MTLRSYDSESEINFLGVFNAFPAEHFRLHTNAIQVYLRINVSGKVDKLVISKLTQWSDTHEFEISDIKSGKELILGPFPLETGIKRYSFSLTTRDEFTLHHAEWLVDDDIVTKKSVDISITTFKKEKYVITNVNALNSYKPISNLDYRVLVIDNGSTLKENEFNPSDHLKLISQANLGGTGGFMRGLMEAKESKTDYILFMDDDILLSPEVIYRAIAIAQISRSHRAFGGMMFHYTKKDKIHEQGGRLPWKVKDFFRAINSGDFLDKELRENSKYDLLYSEGNPDFSGWWFYMAEVINTPILPNFFYKWDDICSSLYLQKHGIKLSIFPTIFVWHEDFDIKRHMYMPDYLSMRNEVFSFAFLNIPEKQMKISFNRTFLVVLRDILMWDYSRAELRIKALQDVLDYRRILSPEFVITGNGTYPVNLGREYTPSMQGITNDIDVYFEKEQSIYQRGFANKRLVRLTISVLKLFLPWKRDTLKNGKIPLLSMTNGNFPIIYPYKKYYLYNPDSDIGYYCEYSFSKTISLLLNLRATLKKVEREYPNIMSYMKSATFDQTYWSKIFNGSKEK
ncbi:glycosyltransferase [Pasteurellaceae bacterium LIM206]|nr:glycosyltransferase [Pasteurellaceae bacterium LIM206]